MTRDAAVAGRAAAIAILLIALGARPGMAGPPGYDYIEIVGAPYFESPLKVDVLDDSTRLEGGSIAGSVSRAVHPNWHLRVTVQYENADTDRVEGLEDPETGNTVVSGKLTLESLQVIAVPTFNVRVAENTDILIGLGVLYADGSAKLKARSEGVGSIEPEDIDESIGGTDWGVYGTGGVRSRVWRGLELFGNFEISSAAILENEIYFDLGARWHVLDALALSASVGVDTDSFIGGFLGVRLDYASLYRSLSDAK